MRVWHGLGVPIFCMSFTHRWRQLVQSFGRKPASLFLRAGIAVICDMLLTTHFMVLLMITVWRKHLIFPTAFYIAFACVELTYVSSALRKVRRLQLSSVVLRGPPRALLCCVCPSRADLRVLGPAEGDASSILPDLWRASTCFLRHFRAEKAIVYFDIVYAYGLHNRHRCSTC